MVKLLISYILQDYLNFGDQANISTFVKVSHYRPGQFRGPPESEVPRIPRQSAQ